MKYVNLFLFLMQEGGKKAANGKSAEPFGGNIWLCLLLGIGFVAIYYFLLIKPKQDQKKEKEEMLDKLEKNDKILTIGGIHGKITNVREDLVTVKIDDSNNTKIKLSKWAISENMTKKEQQDEDDGGSSGSSTEEESKEEDDS